MSDIQKFISSVNAIINACEDYKRLDAMNDKEAMQAESISYNSIRDELEKLKEKMQSQGGDHGQRDQNAIS